MVLGEADRAWMVLDPGQPKRVGVRHQKPQNPLAPGQVADGLAFRLLQAHGHEVGDRTVRGEHRKRPVACLGQPRRQLHQALQHGVQREVGSQQDAGRHQSRLLPAGRGRRGCCGSGFGRRVVDCCHLAWEGTITVPDPDGGRQKRTAVNGLMPDGLGSKARIWSTADTILAPEAAINRTAAGPSPAQLAR